MSVYLLTYLLTYLSHTSMSRTVTFIWRRVKLPLVAEFSQWLIRLCRATNVIARLATLVYKISQMNVHVPVTALPVCLSHFIISQRLHNVMLYVVVVYSETLPVEAPPSYRGVTLKYSYKVTIGAQRFGCPTKLLRLPFRVLVVPGCPLTAIHHHFINKDKVEQWGSLQHLL